MTLRQHLGMQDLDRTIFEIFGYGIVVPEIGVSAA
jgi:hypothetical protein